MSEIIKARSLLTGSIVLPYRVPAETAIEMAEHTLRRFCPDAAAMSPQYSIYKRSVDARRRDMIRFVWCIRITFPEPVELDADALAAAELRVCHEAELKPEKGSAGMTGRPVVVGSGPAGMFCALLLAENGYAPILIERGAPLEERVGIVRAFHAGGPLDTETNVMFGAGGAGTFSDGKLVTRINDPLISYVLGVLHSFGAPDEILYRAKPHVGTDLLRTIVRRTLERITELGGEVRCHCRLDRITDEADGSVTLTTSCGTLRTSAVVLAIGHSARDTYRFLTDAGYDIEAKSFSVGVRIEHPTEVIDRAMFGAHAGDPILGHAEYTLADTRSGRGVYTFCMCPGGEVIAAASEEGGVVVNGMSYHARNGRNSNCALAVSVFPSDHGGTPMSAIEFQRSLEQKAFALGGGGWTAPVETVGDFLSGKTAGFADPSRVLPTYDRGMTRLCDISAVFPDYINRELARGLDVFGKKIAGFDAPEMVMTAPETRTSSPVRIRRGEDFTAPGHPAVYPCGEGAGYAGGITSAAVDGLRTALAVMARFRPIE